MTVGTHDLALFDLGQNNFVRKPFIDGFSDCERFLAANVIEVHHAVMVFDAAVSTGSIFCSGQHGSNSFPALPAPRRLHRRIALVIRFHVLVMARSTRILTGRPNGIYLAFVAELNRHYLAGGEQRLP